MVHLRRLILLSALIYLMSELFGDLMQSVKLKNPNQFSRQRKFHFDNWLYIYSIYIYTMIMGNGFLWDQLNVFEALFSTL